ncbi:MAG: Rpn family recombination-promoting nuclease/putative transposase [bacterium]|nr:Rpn family recombination-promoting nuclease/putative transposase [bacterium]MCM1374887.1 Rpn family recombination-promoting nuclease/putative transposase [Muribaculum sp.]
MNRRKRTTDFIPPKSDVVFKELMRNEEVRRYFISDALSIPPEAIKSVRLENPFLSRRSLQEKQCILDVRMQLNDDSRINVELQIRRLAYWDKRSLYYLAKMYVDNLFSGQRYDRLKKCIVIAILDFAWDENSGYHKVYHLRDKEGQLYSDQFEVHIVELNKKLIGDRLDDWIRLLRVESGEELERMHSGNAGVVKAIDEVKMMNLGRRLKAWYDLRQRDQRDRWALEDAIKEDAYKEGHEEGLERGIEKGIEKGIEEGIERARRQNILELLEECGTVPEDICARIHAEKDSDVLRRWLKLAAHTSNLDDFRTKM